MSFEHTNRMRYEKTPIVATGIMSEQISFKREDSGCPESPVSLETHQIRKNYKTLKQEMEPTEIIDYLVQYEILDTDENAFLSDKCRSKKCDFILRRLIRDSSCLLKLVKILQNEPNDLAGFRCFHSLSCDTAPEPQNPNSDKQVKHSKVLSHNLKCDKNRQKLLDEFGKHINNESFNSILDDFLQEDLITVDKHEEISSLTNKAEAAEMLLASVSSVSPDNPGSLKLLSILKSYEVGDLTDSLLQPVDEEEEENREWEIPVKVTHLDGKLFQFACADVGERTLKSVEVKLNFDDGERVFTYLVNAIPESEVTLAQKTHCSIEKTSEGSIIILLQTEASDAAEKLRQFIENGDISIFLKQLFETEGVRNVLTKEKYRIEIQIKEVHSLTTGFPANALRSTENIQIKYKSILERCHGFLMEELEPGFLLRDDEIASIFTPVRATIKVQTNRTAKNELLLEYLKEQSEETIQFVLKRLEEKNGYIYEQLFPKTEKYKDLDIEQVKKNILDNLPKLLEQMSIGAIQTPLLSTGVISPEELKLLRSNSTSSRTENLQFVKLVLQRGEEAIRIFLRALENSCGETEVLQQLKKTEIEDTSEGKRKHAKIQYEAFDEENGLLFTGNFLLELMKDKDEIPDKESLYVREDQMPPDTGLQYGSQSEDSTSSSSDSDSHAVMPKEVPKKGSQIEKLECDISNLLSKLTRELRKVEKVKDIKKILSARHTSKTLQMEEVRRIYPNKFDAIEEDVSRLQRCLHELQYLTGGVVREEIPYQEKDDVDTQLDQESEIGVSPKSAVYITRQVSVLSFESTDEGTMESDDEEQESQNVLNIKSSKYQSILLVKLHRLETVQSVMKVFRSKEERNKQLTAVKNILNEEQYIKLEKYIIKLQRVSEKILEKPVGECA